MAAPSTTVWGGVVNSGTSKAARLGINRTVTNNSDNVTCSVKVDIYIWTRYRVSDSTNSVYFSWGATNTSNLVKSNVSVTTTNDEWSTSNQILIYSTTGKYNRGTNAATVYCAGKISGIDYIGSAVSTYTSFSIPAKPYYTITYDANGGSGAPDAHGYYYGEDTTLSAVTPTRDGYTFLGWSTSETATSASYNAGQAWSGSNAANYTLYAVWKLNEYTITYNANGGANAPAKQTKKHGIAITLAGSSTFPTRTNYEFVGWSTSTTTATAMYNAGESYNGNSDVTFYAIWKLAYTTPSITDLKVYRCNSSGSQPDDYGTYFKVEFGWSTSQLLGTNNIKSVKIEWKISTATSYSSTNSKIITPNGISGNVESDALGGSLSTDNAYDVRITVTDSTSQTPNYSTVTGLLPKAKFVIDFKAGGDGASIGKPATKGNNSFEMGFTQYDEFDTLAGNGLCAYTGSGDAAIDPNTTLESLILTNKNTPMGSSHFMYIQTFFYNTKSTTANRMQYAMPYKQEGSMYHRYYFDGAWGEWRRHLNADETIAIGTNAQMIRNRIELPYTGIACSYTGGTSSLSIGTTATTVPMTAKNVNTNDVFTLSGGGIVCPYDGTIAISAGVYITPGSSCMAGCYIYKNTTESVSDMRYLTGQFGASIGTRIMNVVAGDVIYLKARSMVNSTAQPNNKATHLSIAYIR